MPAVPHAAEKSRLETPNPPRGMLSRTARGIRHGDLRQHLAAHHSQNGPAPDAASLVHTRSARTPAMLAANHRWRIWLFDGVDEEAGGQQSIQEARESLPTAVVENSSALSGSK